MWTEAGEVVTGAIRCLVVENARTSVANTRRLVAKTSGLFTKTPSEPVWTQTVEVVWGEVLTSGLVQTWLVKRAKRRRLVAILALVAIGALAEVVGLVEIEVKWETGAKLATNGSICDLVHLARVDVGLTLWTNETGQTNASISVHLVNASGRIQTRTGLALVELHFAIDARIARLTNALVCRLVIDARLGLAWYAWRIGTVVNGRFAS